MLFFIFQGTSDTVEIVDETKPCLVKRGEPVYASIKKRTPKGRHCRNLATSPLYNRISQFEMLTEAQVHKTSEG
jgi:hypothetical protein